MTHTRACWTDRAGFTLLELLISMVLLGMLAVALFGVLHFGAQVWRSTGESSLSRDRVFLAQEILTDEIGSAYPKFVRVSADEAYAEFDGSPDRLTFLAPAKAPSGALDWVTIGLTTIDGVPSLVLWTSLELQPNAKPHLETVLLKGVRSLAISYYGAGDPREPPSWHDAWKNNLTIPSLIRIRATLTDGRAVWPVLDIVPHVSVDQSCTYDGLTHYCQGRI